MAPSGVTAHSNNLGTDAAIAGTAGASSATPATLANTYTISDRATRWPNGIPATGGPCIASRYTSIWTQTKGETTIKDELVKGRLSDQIQIHGRQYGRPHVNSPNAAVSSGAQRTLKNRYGDTSISATSFSAGAGSLIDTRNATITATNGSIGRRTRPRSTC